MSWWNRETDAEREARWAEAAAQLPPMTNETDQDQRDAEAAEVLRRAAETQKAGRR